MQSEFREYILTYLHNAEYCYVTIGKEVDTIRAHGEMPRFDKGLWTSGDYDEMSAYGLFEDLVNEDKVLNIENELGLTDWRQIPVDTKVMVSNNGEDWFRRYFKKFDEREQRYVCFDAGSDSWSADPEFYGSYWKYCKLAEDN